MSPPVLSQVVAYVCSAILTPNLGLLLDARYAPVHLTSTQSVVLLTLFSFLSFFGPVLFLMYPPVGSSS